MTTKPDTTVRTVRWSKGFDDLVNQYCQANERTRNWMIKKAMAMMMGMGHMVSNTPEEDTDER